MNYAQIRRYDVTNGPNVRTTLFVSGCKNNCPGCFNKEQQDFNYGTRWDKETEEKFISYVKDPNIHGVNILGGDPFDQTFDRDLINLLARIKKETNKPIWIWSGYMYEDILKDELKREILSYVDVLIDGRFILEKRNLNLKYRGSDNQRVINVIESLAKNKVIEIDI